MVFLFRRRGLFAEALDMLCQLRLEVGCFVLVDDVGLSQFVEHLLNAGIELFSFFLVGHGAQFANGVAHRFCIVAVVLVSFLRLTNSLQS